MSDSHVNLLSLKIDDGVLSSVVKWVSIGWNIVAGYKGGELIRASGEHHVGQELKIGREIVRMYHWH